MARPTDFSQEIINKTKHYVEDYESLGEVIPSVAGLSDYLDIARSTIYKWISEEGKEEFSDIIDKLLSSQEKALLNKGLKGEFNPTITKVIMTKHGYSDKQELLGKDGENLSINVVSYGSKGNNDPV